MPVLILTIAEYFHELLENCGLASIAALSKLCRVMEMAINLAVMLVVAVLCPKYSGAHGARKVINMVLPIQSGDIRSSERAIAFMTYKIQPSEVISFAQGVLAVAIFIVDWEELGGYYLPAVLVIHTVSKRNTFTSIARIHTRHLKQSR